MFWLGLFSLLSPKQEEELRYPLLRTHYWCYAVAPPGGYNIFKLET